MTIENYNYKKKGSGFTGQEVVETCLENIIKWAYTSKRWEWKSSKLSRTKLETWGIILKLL